MTSSRACSACRHPKTDVGASDPGATRGRAYRVGRLDDAVADFEPPWRSPRTTTSARGGANRGAKLTRPEAALDHPITAGDEMRGRP